jgi:hypothetical protein
MANMWAGRGYARGERGSKYEGSWLGQMADHMEVRGWGSLLASTGLQAAEA